MDPERLNQEEIKALKKLANDLMAMGTVRRMITTGILWLSGIVIAGTVLYNAASNLFNWGQR